MQRLFIVLAASVLGCTTEDRISNTAVDASIYEDSPEQTSSESSSAEPITPDDFRTGSPAEGAAIAPDMSAHSSTVNDAAISVHGGTADRDGASASAPSNVVMDAGSVVPDAPRCAETGREDSWGPALRTKFDEAKATCDQELESWLCGEFRLGFDANGCLSRFEVVWGSEAELGVPYEECLVRHLTGSCDPCAAGTNSRAAVSCTLQ